MRKPVVVVGGGLAGLAAAIYLARGGRSVTLFEKRRHLGGRAITNLRHGYRFNLGPHALYRAGAGASVYRDLGIPVRGRHPKVRATALFGRDEHRLPTSWLSLIGTSLLTVRGKLDLAGALIRIRRFGGTRAGSLTAREWLDANVSDETARQLLEALFRLTTYSDRADTESAAAVLAQMKIAMRGAIYVDEGWQKLVDALHSAAVTSGVNFVTSSRIVGVHHDGATVQAVELGGLELDADRMDTQALALPEASPQEVEGARLPAETVLLAVDPATAAELVGEAGAGWTDAAPVTASCLDVALRSLPDPRRTFALGIDEPLYYSVHSAFAQLTPKGGALIHVAKYQRDEYANTAATEAELEFVLDRFQDGWRDLLVHRRFLPSMKVSNAVVAAGTPRPDVTTPVRGLYIAGDWVGSEGMLSDAALASARAAAKAILAS